MFDKFREIWDNILDDQKQFPGIMLIFDQMTMMQNNQFVKNILYHDDDYRDVFHAL